MQIHHKVVIVGGGSPGLTVGSQLAKKINPADIAIIEPSSSIIISPYGHLSAAEFSPEKNLNAMKRISCLKECIG